MNESIRFFVGLDVHKSSTAIAVAECGRLEPRFVGTVGPCLEELLKVLQRIGTSAVVGVVYEAGPTGYGLARALRQRGYICEVVAPAKIPRRPGDRLKTDRRDALMLAQNFRSGNLTPVIVPDAKDEAMRDLSRAREDAVSARLKARQQLKGMLLRLGRPYTGKSSWTSAHERYLATIGFDFAPQNIAFTEYRQAIKAADERVERLTTALREQMEGWRLRKLAQALMCLRGIDVIAAVALTSEIVDFARFAHPRALMGFLGLVPSERSTGDHRRQGRITKTGNAHVRRILVEAAWNYRHSPRISLPIEKRQQSQPKLIRDIAWKAQLRLHKRYLRLSARQMPKNKVCTAIARELCGFIWAIARQVSSPA